MTTLLQAQAQAQYGREAVLSATPARLLTMLYDRLLLDLHRAEQAQRAGSWNDASTALLHAQDIVAELSSSLRVDLWDGAEGLLAVYAFVTTTLRNANVQRDAALTRQAIDLMEPLAAAWHEAAALPTAADSLTSAAPVGGGGLHLGFA
ncbi:flagellar export chaperone FliS [Leifsonia sp. YIM 134122]|uniref:Flagellar export chaperone FliS n=1 Tax=Leifsonia stereocauli TaxID=3134136 RepID=A0ABU9W2I5_9MICO